MKPEKKNNKKTGLPDKLKSGIENLSGVSMDDVKVNYNSNKAAQLQAHAYAQGTVIHLAAGQEKHLPHEAWHVVQQKQGLSKMSIYNNTGRINVQRPFQIFGPLPTKGSYLLFGSSEWLNKGIAEIKVQLFWEKNIPIDFVSHYSAYPQDFKNTSFKVAFSVHKDGVWKLLNDKSFTLFEENNDNTISHISTFKLILRNNFILAESEENSDMFEYNDKTRDGFIKMQLIAPEYAFGHSIFQEVITNEALGKVKESGRVRSFDFIKFWRKRANPTTMPSQPYTPLVNKINVSITYLNPSEKGN
ncbi:MAG: DUF4157 domain-containing protein [Bacteroidetes bacterium]|nr:DUF4157 domain-containing protein [Bacteroidota bacterium]